MATTAGPQHVLLTGATGFVGQAVLEKLLFSCPGTSITLLVRPRGELTAQRRAERLLRKPVLRRWREAVGPGRAAAEFARRVQVLPGDLDDVPDLPDDLDVVIHSASSVSFDLPIDEAFAANVGGPQRLYERLLESGASPHVVHVSTSYVSGLRKGVAEERRLEHDVDHDAEMAAALRARAEVEAASRRPEVLDRLLRRAEVEHRRAGPRAVAAAAEDARVAWVHEELVAHGRTRARSLGWPDVYTFTKAMGERVAETRWQEAGHRLSVVRPTIIESSLRTPYPGWIDGFKVADPLIAAYGRGLLPEFPALADTVLDIVPVDFVVNALLAAVANPPGPGEADYLQVSSGTTNPLRFGQLYQYVREYFSRHPLRDSDGAHVSVPAWSFPHRGAVERALRRRETLVRAADVAVNHLPARPRTRDWISTLYQAGRDLDTLRRFTSLYQPYTEIEVTFDDARTRALLATVPDEHRDEFGFDVSDIDWRSYLQEVHIPGVPGLTRAEGGGRGRTSTAPLPRRDDVVAVFDLQRTVIAASLVEQYLWVELATNPPSTWPGSLATLVGKAPHYIRAEMRDRGDFIRTFMRHYAGTHEEELRRAIRERVQESLRRDVLAEAETRIEAHRQAGHRLVLATGEIDVFVEPVAPLFDVVVAGKMETDADGRWTGHLEHPPLVGESRATWLTRYAREEGIDLSGSYAYGDSYADRPWLSVVGHPHAVNPDARLYRYARAQRWPVHSWTTTAEVWFAPLLRSLRAGAGR